MVHRGGMMNYLRLYANFLKNCFRRETLYRFNFWVSMFTVVLGYLSNVFSLILFMVRELRKYLAGENMKYLFY